jgi:hypothetical protein
MDWKIPCMGNGEAIYIVNFLDTDTKVAIKDCNFGRSSDKLNEGIHEVLVEALHKVPKPFDHRRLL